LQYDAVCCNMFCVWCQLPHAFGCLVCVLQRVAVCCCVLQNVAVCYSVLQCAAVCCGVLYCVLCQLPLVLSLPV